MKTAIVCVETLCGRITPATMGSSLDRERLESLRVSSGASLIGAGTLRTADPVMACPGGILPSGRIRAVVTGSGHIDPAGKALFSGKGPPPVVFTSCAGALALEKTLGGSASVVAVGGDGKGGVDLSQVIRWLSRRGVERLLIEGGGRLNYSALAQGVVDEIHLTLAPRVLGAGRGLSSFQGGAPLGAPFLELELKECVPVETGEIFLTYMVVKE